MEQWLSGSSSGSSEWPISKPAGPGENVTYSLVAYPPKDNYEGRLYDWNWVKKVSCITACSAHGVKVLHCTGLHCV